MSKGNMSGKSDSAFVDIYTRVSSKYLFFEELTISLVRKSFIASLFRRSLRFASLTLSGCFIAALANENRYPLFAAESAIIKNFRDVIRPFERFLSRNYAPSLTRSFFSAIAGSSCEVDWPSARKDSWFLRKIYHA